MSMRGWDEWEREIFENATDGIPAMTENPYLQDLFHDSFFNMDLTSQEKDRAYEELVEFAREQYDLEWDDVFDWEDFRAWYEENS